LGGLRNFKVLILFQVIYLLLPSNTILSSPIRMERRIIIAISMAREIILFIEVVRGFP